MDYTIKWSQFLLRENPSPPLPCFLLFFWPSINSLSISIVIWVFSSCFLVFWPRRRLHRSKTASTWSARKTLQKYYWHNSTDHNRTSDNYFFKSRVQSINFREKKFHEFQKAAYLLLSLLCSHFRLCQSTRGFFKTRDNIYVFSTVSRYIYYISLS